VHFPAYVNGVLRLVRRAYAGIPNYAKRPTLRPLRTLLLLAVATAAGAFTVSAQVQPAPAAAQTPTATTAPIAAATPAAEQAPATPNPPISIASSQPLPDAPGFGTDGDSDGPGYKSVAQGATATIAGTVLDANQAEIEGAQVVLTDRTGAKVRSLETGSNGEFTFTSLPPGTFRLTVTGQGMATYRSPEIKLHAGDFRIVSQVVLPVAATTTNVTVVGDPTELAEQQVQIAIQQRVLGVFPNFYTTYDWNAPPLGPKQKFELAYKDVTDPLSFLGAGIIAGYEQGYNIFPGYGQGAQGYAKRYGAAFANHVSGKMIGSVLLPSLLHQDPRYFYHGSGSVPARFLYAIAAAFITRGDNGHWEPNYSHVLGNFAAGGVSNLYYPSSSRGIKLVIATGLLETAGNAGTNIAREFFLRGLTPKVPSYANGKP
jgi:Carboxypeptidase regulatory-like domain